MKKIILLDSNSLINRAFYALPPMETRQGILTNAIYGFMSMLSRLISDHNPTHIVAVFDTKAPTFRHKMYDKYKATRKGMPDELASQLPYLKELLASMNIKMLEMEGYEADDIIGTIAKRYDYDTIIVSGDRDVLQLIDNNTVVFNTKRGVTNIKVYDLESLAEEGFTPAQIIEYKALAGDASDNIPGATGVGIKTATTLLNDYRDIDTMYQYIDEIKGKLKERLIADKDNVYMSKQLATINTNVPIECELDCMAFTNEFSSRFFEMMEELEFRSLVPRFNAREVLTPQIVPITLDKASVVDINSISQLKEILSQNHDEFSVVFGKDISLAFDYKTEYSIQVAHTLIDIGIAYDDIILALKPLFESSVKKVLFDAKHIMHLLSGYDISLQMPYEDILLKSYLINSTRIPKSVDDIVSGYQLELLATGSLYADKQLDAEMDKAELSLLYRDIELPLIGVLFDMENSGFSIDRHILDTLSQKYDQEIKELTEKIYQITGEIFNINSPQQLGNVLFEKLKLPYGKKTKTGYSVAAEVLAELDHPVIKLLLRYRQIGKLQSTYINGMRAVIDKRTGKVHTIFKQCLTATGRLSSTEPNLQNIPIRHEEGREIRRMFVASPNNLLVTADYSQIELRLLAHFSGDPVLMSAYSSGKDIHAITASKIYNVELEQVTEDMRRDAKAVNFGIIYGISAFGLANNIGITPYEARAFQDRYFEIYPYVKGYMEKNVENAIKDGYIKTIKGRIRYFPEFKSANHNIRKFGERAAMNMPLQGSASDIIKIAMLNVDKGLKANNLSAKLILQVHDELVLDVPKTEIDIVKKILVDAMQNAVSLHVPLTAEAKVGENWFMVD